MVAKAENLEYMSTLKDESIRLIYIDPPFNTSKTQKSKTFKWPEKVVDLEYYDSFGNGVQGYIEFMKPRLRHCYRLLDEKGVLCVHLDYQSVHYIKCLLDEIFGNDNIDIGSNYLINEIIWYYGGNSDPNNFMPRKHDTILVYSKTNSHIFNKQYLPYKESTLKRYNHTDENGKRYKVSNLKKKKNENDPDDIVYMKEGNPVQSVWTDIPVLRKKERLGYPTEKPILLLNRLIKIFTNKNDLVADFFCGCGTTLDSALNLKRNFIGCDGQSDAIKAIKERILRKKLNKDVIQITYPFDAIPKNFKEMNYRDFERKCVLLLEGIPNARTTGDNGVDGRRIKDGAIIQVKQSNNIGAPKIRELLGAMTASRVKKGVFVALSFIDSARNVVNKIRKDGYEIELITANSLQIEIEKRKQVA